jgi:hypothetical protein
MSGEIHVLPPVAVIYHEEVLASGILAPAPPLPDVGIDPAHVKELDQVFSAKNQEAEQVKGMIGLYAGVMLLHDLAIEAFAPAAGELEEEELEEKPRPEPQPDHPEE